MTLLSSIGQNDIKSITDEAKEPKWLTEIREHAFSKYLNLPSEVSPLYKKYSDVNHLKPEHIYIPDQITKCEPHGDLRARLDELENGIGIIQIGSAINQILFPNELSKQGVIILDLRQAIQIHEELIKKHMAINQLNYEEDKFLALEASAFRSGLFIYIPKNVMVQDPIRIVNSLADDGTSSITRNIIILDTGSKATVVQEIYAPQANARKDVQQGYFELVECHVNPSAHLEMVTLQAMSGDTINFSNKKAFIERDAKMSWYLGMFGSQLSRYKIDSIMKGPGSSAEDVEIIFGTERQSFDVTSNLFHYGHNSRGRVLVKSVMKDMSKSLFKGMIKIGKEAKATESYLAGHAILLDKAAKSDAIPGLEIETNEVKATHSASVAQLDEAQVFYLMCRGLSREGAKREIVNGFLEPLSRKMGPTIRAWVNYLIENKWSGKPLMLRIDEAMEQILEVEKSRYRENQDIFEKHYKYR
ncbi:MAG TPA: SufD family Fe-S cluster assembly protein [Nitrososphaeraceae archaeon]|nr:SufD family Fe-S cluster assembly protein [Nitrososphaeraceae archaeon]